MKLMLGFMLTLPTILLDVPISTDSTATTTKRRSNRPEEGSFPIPGTSGYSFYFDPTSPYDATLLIGTTNIVNCLNLFIQQLAVDHISHQRTDEIQTPQLQTWLTPFGTEFYARFEPYDFLQFTPWALKYGTAVQAILTVTRYVIQFEIQTARQFRIVDPMKKGVALGAFFTLHALEGNEVDRNGTGMSSGFNSSSNNSSSSSGGGGGLEIESS